jgi:hypothetical protein
MASRGGEHQAAAVEAPAPTGERAAAAVAPHVLSILALQRSAGNQAAAAALRALQRSATDGRPPMNPGRASDRILARAWQKKPQKKGGRGINTGSSTMKKRLLELVPEMKIVEQGQMAVDPENSKWRIDYQGPSHGPNGEDYVSMAAQVDSGTFASCHCPVGFGIGQRRAGMREAIMQNDALWWVPDPVAEEEQEKVVPKKGGGGGKGGGGKKGGGGGGKGGYGKKGQAAQGGGQRIKV